jgi:hypothetical protein
VASTGAVRIPRRNPDELIIVLLGKADGGTTHMLDPEVHDPVDLCVNPARRLGKQLQQFEDAVRAALASGPLL